MEEGMTATPGPWMVTKGTMSAQWRVVDNFDNSIAHTGFGEEAMANARLIAAAPDMLAALKALVWAADQTGGTTPTVDRARTAIAKATGKPAGEVEP